MECVSNFLNYFTSQYPWILEVLAIIGLICMSFILFKIPKISLTLIKKIFSRYEVQIALGIICVLAACGEYKYSYEITTKEAVFMKVFLKKIDYNKCLY